MPDHPEKPGLPPQEDAPHTEAGPRAGVGASYLQRGDKIGPYTILELLGAGGMGVVYAAYDPRLDRKVALKLVRSDFGDDPQAFEEDQQRLLREATAMARLSHPNIVHVHEVGTFESAVFMAMEFVRGSDLRTWLKNQETIEWRDVLELLLQAGHGLAEAHDAGLVHRDFKPDNVLVGSSNRVWVTDFGLARAAGMNPGDVELGDQKISDSLTSPLTMVGTFVGTPEYSAPERFSGGEVDTRADQFSFAVTLYEALYGERPFGGNTVAALYNNMVNGKIEDAPRDRHVPPWLRQKILKALSPDPGERYEDMHAFLQDLEHDPTIARKRLAITAGATLLVLVAAVTAWSVTRYEHPLCTEPNTTLAGVWDDEVKSELERRFEHSTARANWTAVRSRLDGYANQWNDLQTRACSLATDPDTRVQANARLQCLRRVRMQLASFTQYFKDDPSLQEAPQTLLSYRNPCDAIPETISDTPPPENEASDESRVAIERELARLKTLYYGRDTHEATSQVQKLLDAIDDDTPPELRAEVLLFRGTMGQFADGQDEIEEAQRYLEDASNLALSIGADDIAATAQIRLIRNLALKQYDAQEARKASLRAEALVERLGSPPFLVRELRQQQGILYALEGDVERAYAVQKEALELEGFVDMNNWSILNNQAVAAESLGLWDEAGSLQRELLSFSTANLGVHHRVQYARRALGNHLLMSGRYQEARELLEISWLENSTPANGILFSWLTTGKPERVLESLAESVRQTKAAGGRVVFERAAAMAMAHADLGHQDEARAWARTAAGSLHTDAIPLIQYDIGMRSWVAAQLGGRLIDLGDLQLAGTVLTQQHDELTSAFPGHPVRGHLAFELYRLNQLENRPVLAERFSHEAQQWLSVISAEHPALAELKARAERP